MILSGPISFVIYKRKTPTAKTIGVLFQEVPLNIMAVVQWMSK